MHHEPLRTPTSPRMSTDSLFGDESPVPRALEEARGTRHGIELIDALFCVIAQRPFTPAVAVMLAGMTLANLLEPEALSIDLRAVIRVRFAHRPV